MRRNASSDAGDRRGKVELREIDGNHLTFDVRCHDETDLISSGTHERFIVNLSGTVFK
ncbi:thioesterase, FlK family [Advenella mimigardefordensis]|uniref:thioesterase, FlK family n=1 Tax=Advenella mimigardefordensis TaxID=302406 RepID=UPI003898E2BC